MGVDVEPTLSEDLGLSPDVDSSLRLLWARQHENQQQGEGQEVRIDVQSETHVQETLTARLEEVVVRTDVQAETQVQKMLKARLEARGVRVPPPPKQVTKSKEDTNSDTPLC